MFVGGLLNSSKAQAYSIQARDRRAVDVSGLIAVVVCVVCLSCAAVEPIVS